MFKKVILLTIISLSITICNSQSNKKHHTVEVDYRPYYQQREKAKKLYNQKEFKESFDIYNKLFKEYDPIIELNASDYVSYIKSAELSGSCYSRFNVMKVLISDLGYSKKWIEENETLYSVFLKSGIDDEIYKILRDRYLSSIDYELRMMVVEIIKRDQEYRRGYNGADKTERLKAVDAINERAIKTIFDKYGYPNAKLIGNNTIDENFIELTFVLRHTSDSLKENYIFPKLLEFVKQGTCLPAYYKSLSDGYQFMKRQPSILEYSDQIDSAIIDKNRYDAGLLVGN